MYMKIIMRRDSDIVDSENIRIDNADRRCFSNGTEIVKFENSIKLIISFYREKGIPYFRERN